ncbi:unnamed protein product [Fusarium equiseti]|uniref:Uncharacterized protein n=1 Tax=Fusarium equiseti TaxID=61235 RepID=A0A8J2IWH9_FUSEQ|nr:unnamed protein product [Fusarium equiseti]
MAPQGNKNHSRGRSRNRKGTVWEDEFPDDASDLKILKKAAADAQRAVAAKELADSRRSGSAAGTGNSGAGRGNNSPAPSNASGRGGLSGPGNSRVRGLSASVFGKRGQKSRSSSVNTVGKSGKGSYGGVSKDIAKPHTPIPMVPEAQIRQYTIGSGMNIRHAVNTSLGGGAQDRFMAPTSTGGIIASTNRWQDGNDILKRAMDTAGPGTLTLEVQPWKKGQLSFVKRRATATKVINSTGRSEVKALERGVELLSTRPGSSCVECGEDHALRDCLYTPKGYVYGCTLCNTTDHAVDSCNQFKDLSIKDQAGLLVYERGNKPMLETSKDQPKWDWYLREYLKQAGEDAALPESLPWTMEFAKEVRQREDFGELQTRWDADRNPDDLPRDPAHGSSEDIAKAWLGNHIYPNRPSDVSKPKGGNFPAPSTKEGFDVALDAMLTSADHARDRRARDAAMDQEQPEDEPAERDTDMIQ